MSDRMPEGMPGRMPEYMSDRMPLGGDRSKTKQFVLLICFVEMLGQFELCFVLRFSPVLHGVCQWSRQTQRSSA